MKVIRHTLTVLAVLVTATPAAALSCLRPDVIRLYEQARDSEDVYSIVYGQLNIPTPINYPDKDASGGYGEDASADTTARLTGTSLGDAGFATPFDQEVTLRVSCVLTWCAPEPSTGEDVIAALRHSDGGLILDLDVCGANAIPASGDDEARVLNCHRFDNCQAQD